MQTDEKRIGIFGGTFDPVHLAHLAAGEAARVQFSLQKVIFVPARLSPLKTGHSASPAQRLKMLEYAIEGNAFLEVSDVEIRRPGPSYTYDSVQAFRSLYPEGRFFFIIGSDAFAELAAWHRIENLTESVTFLVAKRPGWEKGEVPDGLKVRYQFLDFPGLDISATAIRDRLAAGKSVRYLIPDKVLEYIIREKIYQKF